MYTLLFKQLAMLCILTGVIINNVFSQCTGLTPGMGTPTNESGTISTTVNWTSSFKYIVGDITISSSGILNISSSNIKVANDVQIFVQAGGELHISSDTDIYGEEDGGSSYRLWDGILVEGEGILTMDDSQIFYAKIAIQGNNSSDLQSFIDIETSCFENNEIGVYFGPNRLIEESELSIQSTEFHAPDLVDELADQVGDYGVLVYLTDHEYGVQIGNDDEYDPADDNYFHHIGMAIRASNSDLKVQNCKIEEIDYNSGALNFPSGSPFTETIDECFGIMATGAANISIPAYVLEVGTATSDDANNIIYNVRHAIYAEEYVNTEIHLNEITSSSATFIMDNAIEIVDYPEENSSHNIERNYIAYYVKDGIELLNIDFGPVNIEGNTLINTTTGLFGENAIKLVGSTPVEATIIANEIDEAITGILVNGIDAPLIEGNIIEFYSPSGFISPGYGIHVLNGEDAQIAENQITGNCTTGSCSGNVRGIKLDGCPEFISDKNIIYDCSVAIWCENNVNLGNLTCNEIHDCPIGVLLLNI